MTDHPPSPERSARIVQELQDAVQRLHVLAQQPRVVVIAGTRSDGIRPMAWQVLFERSFGGDVPALHYRGLRAGALPELLTRGYDSETTPEGTPWASPRLGDAMARGPVIGAFRADRLPDDVAQALVGVLVFEDDGLHRDGVKALVGELGLS
jgi:hypothetical protein